MKQLESDGPTLVVDVDEVARHVGPELALDAARRAATYQLDDATSVGRVTLGYPDGWLRLLGAAVPALGVVGYKEFHLAAGNKVRYQVHLFAIADGRPLAIVDGALLTPLRTSAAAAAAATSYMGEDPPPVRVGVIGSGTEAEAGLRALAAALPVKSVTVTSRQASNRGSFAERMSRQIGVGVEPVAEVAAVCERADLVYVGTASGGQTVVDAVGLGEVALVLSIGSTLPSQRELAADVLAGASLVIIDTPEVLTESGDVLAALERGMDHHRVCTLGEFLAAPERPSGRTVYKSIGSPEQDVVLAAAVLDAAREHGFGREVESLAAVKRNLS